LYFLNIIELLPKRRLTG